MLLAYNTKLNTAFHWFHTSKAFDNKRDHRTYAQVTKSTKNLNEIKGSKPSYSDPRIVTATNEKNKVKSRLVAPSKVSVNAQGCTSPRKTLPSRSWIQTKRDRPASQQKGFLENRFHILTDWGDNSQEICYTEEGGFHGEVQPCKVTHVLSSDNHAHIPSHHGNLKPDTNQNCYVDMVQCNNTKALPQDHTETNETLLSVIDASKPPIQNMSSCKNDTRNNVSQPFMAKTQKHVTKQDTDDDSLDNQKIPFYVWKNRHHSKDRVACLTQNGGDFGYIPLNDLLLYHGPNVSWERVPNILETHK